MLYNGAKPWTASRETRALVTPTRPWLAPYQPAQRYWLLDLRWVAAEDLPYRNLLRAVVRLEQSRSPVDMVRAVQALRRWLRHRGADELQRAFADWIGQLAERIAPAGVAVPPLRSLEEAQMSLVERVAEWPRQWLREGREQGLTEGVDQQRALLCRLAAARFDAATADRLAELLAPVADPVRLAEVGDRLVRCADAIEFLASLDPASPP